jgi:hypothetical protein
LRSRCSAYSILTRGPREEEVEEGEEVVEGGEEKEG